MSFTNDVLGDAASNEVLEAMASVRVHYDQVCSKLFSNPHDIDIGCTTSDIDSILYCVVESLADYPCEFSSGFPFPTWIRLKRKRNVHIMGRHCRDVKDVELGVALLCQRIRQKQRRF